MKILEHIRGQRIVIGGDYESPGSDGCAAGCLCGCLAPVLLAATLMAIGVYFPSEWLLGGWLALTVIGLYIMYFVNSTNEDAERLVIDRSRDEFVWNEWKGKGKTREHRLRLSDITCLTVSEGSHSEHRLDVSLNVSSPSIPKESQEREPAGFGMVFGVVWLWLTLSGKRHRKWDEEGPGFDSHADETDDSEPTASLDLSLDWMSKGDVQAFGVLIAEVMGLNRYQPDPDDDDDHQFLRSGGTPIQDMEFASPARSPLAILQSSENTRDPWRSIKGVKKADDEIKISGGGWLSLLTAPVILASVFGFMFQWDPETTWDLVSRDLFCALVIAGTIAVFVNSLTSSEISRVVFALPQSELRIKTPRGELTASFSQIDRVVLANKSLVIDTLTGSIDVPLDLDNAERDQREALALDLARILGKSAYSFDREDGEEDDDE